MSVEPIPYSVPEGLNTSLVPGDLQSGYFRSERRCPECGRCLNTNGTGRFRCPECEYRDIQDVSKLHAAGLDYVEYIPKKAAVFIPGSQRFA